MTAIMTLAAALAARHDQAIHYRPVAASIAARMERTKKVANEAKEGRGNVWEAFKTAIRVALEHEHDTRTLRIGLETACAEAEIPPGSARSYISTVAHLYDDLLEGKLTGTDISLMSVAAARKRYRKAPGKVELIVQMIRGWDDETLSALLAVLSNDAACETIQQMAAA